MPVELVIILVAVALVGIALALRGARVFGVLLALFAAHYAFYDSQLRGCYYDTCDRFYYLFPLLVAHFVVLLVAAGLTIAAARRPRRRARPRSGRSG